MGELVLASRNRGKIRELTELLADLDVTVLSCSDFAGFPEVEEDADSFEGNALKKARAVAQAIGRAAVADDSGLEVDLLGGAPGVRSARYGGPELDDRERCYYLLEQLHRTGVRSSPARFRCALALVAADGGEHLFAGVWEGVVEGPLRGAGGFGYDPIFVVPELGLTAAELGPEEKNRLSHRGQALAQLADLLRNQPEVLAR